MADAQRPLRQQVQNAQPRLIAQAAINFHEFHVYLNVYMLYKVYTSFFEYENNLHVSPCNFWERGYVLARLNPEDGGNIKPFSPHLYAVPRHTVGRRRTNFISGGIQIAPCFRWEITAN